MDRNWDSIEALWQMKEEIKGDSELEAAFAADTAAGVLAALAASARGTRFLEQRLDPYRSEFGRKAVWSHEFVFPTWFENPAPIVEALRGYLETDYDYPATLAAVRADLDGAVAELLAAAPEGAARDGLRSTLELSLGLNPLTPDHHFYIDQGTNARLRLVLVAIGRKLAAAGAIDDAEDVMFLRYNELRAVIGDASSLDARTLIGERRDAREAAFEIRPPDWVGTATEDALAFPYLTLWGFPEKFHRPRSVSREQIVGLAASAGVVEGPARVVESLAEFDQVQAGDILVCRMTNPGVGRALHEDRRPRHRRRRHGGAPCRRGARVRVARRRRHLERDPADHDGPARARQRRDRDRGRARVSGGVISRPVLRDQVKDVLLERIARGDYRPGERLVETAIARELGVSQAPVREALRDLDQLGLVVHEPNRGCSVRRVSNSELREAFPVRAALEALASRLAAPRIGEADLARLDALLEEMLVAARSSDPLAQAHANARFHADDRRGGRQCDARAAVVAARAVRAHRT